MQETWDGEPVASEPPYGASVVVYRRATEGCELLLLHRAQRPITDGADWEWTPPAGARRPGESISNCVSRELLEETGLVLQPTLTAHGTPDWPVYVAEAPSDASITPDSEHDSFVWVGAGEAEARCRPAFIGDYLRRVVADIPVCGIDRAV